MADWDFEAIEVAARREALRVACLVIAERINADHSDCVSACCPCPCGSEARYVERRAKSFTSSLGEMTLKRAYFYCNNCNRGFCPRDRILGLEHGSLSPHVLRMVGIVGGQASFKEGHELLDELAGVHVSTKQIEREAERLGREIAQDERTIFELEPIRELPQTL